MPLAERHFSLLIALLVVSSASSAIAENETPEQAESASTSGEEAAPTGEGDVGQAESQEESEANSSSQSAPMSAWGFGGPQPGRIAVSLGGGWPNAWLDLDYGATERLGVGLRVGYLYGLPTGGIQTASGVTVELPTRLGLLRRSNLEVALDVVAGVVVSLDYRLSATADDIDDDEDTGLIPSNQLRPLGTQLTVGVTVSWQLTSTIGLKLGFEIPATLVLVMADRPYDDTWELAIPFAARVGMVWRALQWMGLFAVVDVGPSLMVTPSEWASDGYTHEVGVDVYLHASAGITFAPWP